MTEETTEEIVEWLQVKVAHLEESAEKMPSVSEALQLILYVLEELVEDESEEITNALDRIAQLADITR